MAMYRLTRPARRDIAAILRESRTDHGDEAEIRYRALLLAALRRVASDPIGPATIGRDQIWPGLRSLHIRHCRRESPEATVARPVHLVFYRVDRLGPVTIMRVLHERMDLSRHVGMPA